MIMGSTSGKLVNDWFKILSLVSYSLLCLIMLDHS